MSVVQGQGAWLGNAGLWGSACRTLVQTWPFSGHCSVVLLHERDLQTSPYKSRVMLLLLFPDFPMMLLLPTAEGSSCRNGN